MRRRACALLEHDVAAGNSPQASRPATEEQHTSRAAEASARRWVTTSRNASDDAVLVLVATKADLLPPAELYRARAALAELAARLGVRHHHLVSSKTSEGCPRFSEDLDTLALDIAPRSRDCAGALPPPAVSEEWGCCWY